MALTKISRSLLDTGVSDSSDATAITINSSEEVSISKSITFTPNTFTFEDNKIATYSNNYMYIYGGSAGTVIGDNSGAANRIILRDSNTIEFHINGSEKMRITDNGSVCINTTSPINSAHLTVKENDGFAVANTAGLYRQLYMTSAGNLKFWNGSNQGELSSAGAWNDASDVKIKKDIEDINYGLETVKNLKPRKYKMKVDELQQIGFIAQEIETIIPEVVSTDVNRNGEEYKSLSYSHLTAVLAKAIQEQQEIIDDLKARIEVLEA